MARHWLALVLLFAIAVSPERLLTTFALGQSPRTQIELDGQIFTLPAGFTIERAAGPGLVERPITCDFDELGRLYVAESSGTNDKVEKQLAERPHRILRLIDRDGDGRFDERTVFADQMMFPEGTLWLDGSLYVSAPPSIWKLTDTNDDGVADERVEWFRGGTLTGCANDLHGPYEGLDGRIYWCKGAFAEQRYPRPGAPDLVTKAAHIFRARPDGGGIESVMTGGMDNPVDVVFLPGGDRIFTTTFLQHPASGLRDGLIHAVHGGVYGKIHEVIESHVRTGDILPPLAHLGPAAPCGLTRYEATSFGADYRHNLFATLFNLHKVTRHTLTPQGGSYVSRDEDFLISNNIDFHPTDVQADADGSLLVVNTGGWYKLCCPTSQLWKPDILGAIYRIRRTDAAAVLDPRGRELNWCERVSGAELASRLSDERPAVRLRAARELARRSRGAAAATFVQEAVAALTELLNPAMTATTREAAVWALTRLDASAARQAVRRALHDPHDDVRLAALQAVSLHRDAAARDGVLANLRSTSGRHLRVAAECLGRMGDKANIEPLRERLEQLGQLVAQQSPSPREATLADRFVEHALLFALLELEAGPALRPYLDSDQPWLRRAALLVLDQSASGRLKAAEVAPSLSSTQPVVRETAAWIASRHAEWAGDLAASLQDRLRSAGNLPAGPPDAPATTELIKQLALFARHADVAALLTQVVRNNEAPLAARMIALRAMRTSGLRETPVAWWGACRVALRESLDSLPPVGDQTNSSRSSSQDVPAPTAPSTKAKPSTPAAVRANASPALLIGELASTLRELTPAKIADAELGKTLVAVAEDRRLEVAVRLDALAAIPAGLPLVSNDLWNFLTQQLSSEVAVTRRMAAADVIRKASLTPQQLAQLASLMAEVGPLEADRLLSTFEGSTDEELGLMLLRKLRGSKVVAGLRADALRQALAKYPAPVQQELSNLLAAIHVNEARQRERLEQLLSSLRAGDVRRGQAVFHSAKAACGSCHTTGYIGGKVGPDLTRIGSIRAERDLLESIVYPSLSFVRSYEPVSVMTVHGKTYNGLVKKSSSDEIVLAINATDEIRLPRNEIEELRPSQVSVMPSGLDQQLTPQELADLIAFLRSSK
jgi:putative membrane-bound dehydrogenase-like protein